jgi:probable F420-dependent oxidoreductase
MAADSQPLPSTDRNNVFDVTSPKPELGRYGVWTGRPVTPELAVEIQKLGFGTLWLGASQGAQVKFVEPILANTTNLTVVAGVAIWSPPAEAMAGSFHLIDTAHPGRFLLGVGAGHREPYDALVDYLDDLDAAEVPGRGRVLAALGPQVLKLAARRSAGAQSYLTTPEHTERARELVGDTVYLAPQHSVVLSLDPDKARAIGRKEVAEALDITDYVNNCRRLGFAEGDLAKPGSDTMIDAVVAHGSAQDIASRLSEHIDAGADHVAIKVLGSPETLLPTLTALSDRVQTTTDRIPPS